MFLKNSRYASVPQVQATLRDGTQVTAVQLRPLQAAGGDATHVTSNERLDVMAYRAYGDGTRFWYIADANSAMDARHLFEQWLEDDANAAPLSIVVPEA